MIIANTPLNLQAIALEEAETKIREIIKNGYFRRENQTTIGKKVDKAINEALKGVKLPVLRTAAIKSLRNFAERQYEEYKRSFAGNYELVVALMALSGKGDNNSIINVPKKKAEETVARANLYGVPLQKFSQDYFKENVIPALNRLCNQYALDPDDITGRNSLRNRAEMEVRYAKHLDEIATLKAAGVKLAIASVHADCSGRCRPFQGRVYSLDGTYGTTDDGRKYVPLEVATDIFYTTKAGKTYKNGLLGFNCRHYLVAYKSGYRFPKPNAAEERKQYAITVRQRELERNVRFWRTRAITLKGVDRAGYLNARQKAIEWNNRYIDFSKANERAYYPSRTKII